LKALFGYSKSNFTETLWGRVTNGDIRAPGFSRLGFRADESRGPSGDTEQGRQCMYKSKNEARSFNP